MRVATVDIGTNTVLLLIAERGEAGDLRAVEEHATITRLGEGVDATRTLKPAAIERTRACLEQYAERVRVLEVERVAVVATSAMRDARGGETVLSTVRSLFKTDARVISGDEEARLTIAGAISGLGCQSGDALVAFDIGGGSTEVVSGKLVGERVNIEYARSFDVGSVRLTERLIRSDPPTEQEQETILNCAREAFASVPLLDRQSLPIGIAGTVTTLAAISLGLDSYDGTRVHGHIMSSDELRRVTTRLASLRLTERRLIPGLPAQRADVIVAGGLIAISLLDHFGASKCRISDRGVRWGLALEMAELQNSPLTESPPGH